jgi:predicted RNA methylase
MSAAGRGGPRIASDNYPTPAWATRRILEAIELFHYPVTGPHVLEPCAGEGAIVSVVREVGPRLWGGTPDVVATDVRETAATTLAGSFDATKPLGLGCTFNLLITNPPFAVAHEIIQAQRDTATLCVYLLRSSFIAGERAEAYRHDMPDEYRLPERPEFIRSVKCKRRLADGRRIDGCGWSEKIAMSEPMFAACPYCGSPELQSSTTDSTPYSWFVWTPQRRSVGRSIILPSTPLEERKALAA